MKRILILLIALVFSFGLVGCNNDNQSKKEEYEQLSRRVFVKTLNTQDEEIIGENEVQNEMIEEKYDEMINIPLDYYDFTMSSVSGIPLILYYPNNKAIFKCIINSGSFKYDSQESNRNAYSGELVFWCPNESKESTNKAYVDIIVKEDNYIVGYAVIEITKDNAITFVPKLLKASIFPKQNGEYQNITETQVKMLINSIKNM